MGTRDYLVLGMGLLVCSIMVPHSVAAQAWLADRNRAEGPGIRLGDFELHPGIGAEAGFESNPFLESDIVATDGNLIVSEAVKPSAVVRVSPHLYISTIGEERREAGALAREESGRKVLPPPFAFRGGVSGSLQWFGVGPGDGNDNGLGQTRWLGNLDLSEDILAERPFSAHFNQEANVSQLPVQGQQSNHYHLGLGGRMELGTVGGLLRGRLGYQFNLDRFDASQNNGYDHNITQGLYWQFLPKTVLFQDTEITFHSFDETGTGFELIADKENSTRVTTRVGLNGAVTRELAATLALGYSVMLFENGALDTFDSLSDVERQALVGQLGLKWRPSPRATASLQYGRSLGSALQGNTVVTDAFTARTEVLLGGALLLTASGALTFLDYGEDGQQAAFAPLLQTSDLTLLDGEGIDVGAFRSDTLLRLDFSGEYRFTNWFALTGQVRYDTNLSDYAFLFPETSGQSIRFASPVGFSNVVAVLGLRAFL